MSVQSVLNEINIAEQDAAAVAAALAVPGQPALTKALVLVQGIGATVGSLEANPLNQLLTTGITAATSGVVQLIFSLTALFHKQSAPASPTASPTVTS